MYSLLFLGFVSLAFSLLLTPLVRNLAWHFGIVDQPDQQRKIHTSPIPRMGGVAIFAAVICAYGLLLIVRLSSGAIVLAGLPLVFHLLPALAIVFGIGIVDDIFSVRPWIRLAVETVAAIFAWIGGIQITAIAGYSFSGAVISFVVTVLWIVTCTNAINLIDGVDGLASGVCLFAAVTMLTAALIDHNFAMALAIVPLAGALLGFLRFNFIPASIFLGDCGSLTLGFPAGLHRCGVGRKVHCAPGPHRTTDGAWLFRSSMFALPWRAVWSADNRFLQQTTRTFITNSCCVAFLRGTLCSLSMASALLARLRPFCWR